MQSVVKPTTKSASEREQAAEAQLLLEMVQGIRQWHPRMGGRKLYHELKKPMVALGIKCGRDNFFAFLKAHDLLVPRKRNRRRTTHPGR